MATKEELIHDINIVTLISSKQDMSLPSNAEKFLKYLEQKQSFKTGIGQQYLERLKQIAERSNPDTCFVCKKNNAYDGILCENCMQKYTRGTKDFYKKPEQDLSLVLDKSVNDIKPEMPSLALDSVPGNVVNPNNNFNSSGVENNQQKKGISMIGRTSGIAIAAFVTSIIALWPVSIVLSIVDLKEKDGRKHGFATAALVISLILICCTVIVAYDEIKNDNTNTKNVEETGYVSSDNDNSNQNSSADSVGNTTIADFAHINVSAEQLIQALKYNYDSLAQDAADVILDTSMLDFRYSHTAPLLKYDSSGEKTPMSGYESKVYNIYVYVFSKEEYYDTGFLFSIAVDEQNNVQACNLTYPNSSSYDTQKGYDLTLMSLALVNSIAPETIGNDNIGANIAMDAFDYGEQKDKQIQTGDYIYSGNVFVPFFIAQTKEIYLEKWGESTYKTMVIDLSNQNNRNKTLETIENRNVRENESNKSMDASGLNSYSYAENLDDLLQNNQPIQH